MELNRYGLKPMKSARKRQSTGQNWKNYRYEVLSSHMLARDEKNKPLFRISPEAIRTRTDFESRKWKRYVAKGEDGIPRIIDLKGHEVDRNAGDDFAPGFDHGTDAVEYAMVSEFVKGLYTIKPKEAKPVDVYEGADEPEVAPKVSPELANLAHHLGQLMAEKKKRLLSGKFKVDRFGTSY
jgi:hypothetical protein